ncbi:MAG: adenylyltransferase/cytidyltransferase family protein [Candidatus Omnitrophica bacterium]|nr:adenylyltransferase/cytidyltransferase family protein [Candidatus Omnitrophota bacterium]
MNQIANKKIKDIESLAKTVATLKKKGKKVVQCHGVFDLIHLGHIRHFNLAKKEGDILIVTLTKDKHVKRGPGRPIFNELLRAETLASLEITDYVAVVESPTAIEAIKTLRPDVYVKGSDYKEKAKDVTGMIYDEEEAVKSVGGRLAFTDDITFSSSHLINNYLESYPPGTIKYLKAIGKRYSIDDVLSSLRKPKSMKALVLGDAIIDQYHYCSPMGKSAKESLVVTRFVEDEMFAGGAFATANNVASICDQVDFITVLGEQETLQSFIQGKLSANVQPTFFYRSETCTTIKRRYVDNWSKKKLFEICFMKDNLISKSIETKILKHLKNVISEYDLVIVSDFGHGLMTPGIIDFVCRSAKYLAINVQTNSANRGFNLVTKYPRADCVCIDYRELCLAAHDKYSDYKTLIKKVNSLISTEYIIATRGHLGSVCYSEKDGFHDTPAFADKVVDLIGAGDAFFAFVAPCFAAGIPQELVSFIGNAVGSLAVQIICNREPVSAVDLSKFITRLLK